MVGLANYEWYVPLWRAMRATSEGRWGAAEELAHEAREQRALVLRERGAADRAARLLEQARAAYERLEMRASAAVG